MADENASFGKSQEEILGDSFDLIEYVKNRNSVLAMHVVVVGTSIVLAPSTNLKILNSRPVASS